LEHFGNFESSNILVDCEVLLLDDEDISGGEHVWDPFHFKSDTVIISFLDNHKSEGVICGEVIDDLVVALALQFIEQHLLFHTQKHPEVSKVALECGDILLVDR